MTNHFDYPVLTARATDGDTLAVILDLGFGLRMDLKIRLLNIDTPELAVPTQRAAAEKARGAVASWLAAHAGQIRCTTFKPDKYGGRYLGAVYGPDGDLSAWLLAEHLAKPYRNTERHWTDEELTRIERWQNQEPPA